MNNTEKKFNEYKRLIQGKVLPKHEAENRLLQDEVSDLKKRLIVALDILYLNGNFPEYEHQTNNRSHQDRNLNGIESRVQTSSRLISATLRKQAFNNQN